MTAGGWRRIAPVLALARPPILLTLACALFVLQLAPTARDLRESQRAQRALDAQIERVVGAEAARRAVVAMTVHGPLADPAPTVDIGGHAVQVGRGHRDGVAVIEVRVGGGRLLRYPLLEGRMPQALGYPLSLLARSRPESRPQRLARGTELPPGHAPRLVDQADWPRLQRILRARLAGGGNRGEGLRRDDDIALLRLAKGTDALDHVPAVDPRDGVWRPRGVHGGVLWVDGHLWIDHGDEPLRIDVPSALTIVVRGNLYVGRTVRVVGPGRVLWVVEPGERGVFRDLDADGARSRGDVVPGTAAPGRRPSIEGGGAVWFGLPGGHQPPARLVFEGSLLVGGELHLRAGEVVVGGALLLGEGMTDFPGHRRLVLGGSLPDLRVARFPGIVLHGVPQVAPAPPGGG